MTPPQKLRHGREARNPKWRVAVPPVPVLKHPGGAPQLRPTHLQPVEHVHRSHFPPPPPHLPLFHSRHAEESAERPHLITVVRPCQTSLRKITVLLNRKGVISFEQLLLDISEALGFPRWHRARVTRLYTTHAREVKGVCDFFNGEAAFLAFGKARPELGSVQEALEELFPEHSRYCADASKAWEKKLRLAPDKAAKADSGYSEGTDGSGANQERHQHTNTHVKNNTNAHTSQHADTQQLENHNPDSQKSNKKTSCRKLAHLPNNLQKLHVRGGVKEQQLSVVSPFKRENYPRDAHTPSSIPCENCLARKSEVTNSLSRRVPLPPVCRKQKGGSHVEHEVKNLDICFNPSPSQAVSRDDEKSSLPSQLLNPDPNGDASHKDTENGESVPLPSDGRDVTLSDIERCYEIGRLLGDGNFAVVRECRCRDNGKTLAVKIVERSKLIGREHMMQNELSLLGSLCHPRIVRLLAHHHTHTHSYLVMELVSGGDLFETISDRGKFSEAEAGLMVSDVSEALNYIHGKSIVHRDLKPENLLVEQVDVGVCRLKLGDFGLAMVVTEPVFTICGTPTYVAPEILCETGYGVAVDIWALGVILYILLCGFPPFRSRHRDQEELFKLIKQAQLQFPSPYWDSISEEARSLVRTLLQPDPTVRPTAAQTLLHHWVNTMASVCRQRALTDQTLGKTADIAELQEIQKPPQTNAALTDKTPEHLGSKWDISLSRHEGLTVQGQDENKPSLQQETSTVHITPLQDHDTTPVHSCGQEKNLSLSAGHHSKREIQDPGPKLPNTQSDGLLHNPN
ncbi:serine/threonine-protein kinase DCLK3 [Cololabis saira]|uniref:serine/threonine-protein kinase DCLK3 n=1 Tax=Cololabis saira TaxID=129043 RepID=UPI002AD56EDD|nr:serine/threonine-protein kinase DCLK3 [Cololabis saira]